MPGRAAIRFVMFTVEACGCLGWPELVQACMEPGRHRVGDLKHPQEHVFVLGDAAAFRRVAAEQRGDVPLVWISALNK